MKSIFFYILSFFTLGVIHAQNEFSSYKILQDRKSGINIKVKEEQKFAGIIDEGIYKGFSSFGLINTIYLPNGKKIILPKDEIVIGTSNGSLITKKYDVNIDNSIVNSYKINNNGLEKDGSILFNGQCQVNVFTNGIILITDEWELYGLEISLYNNNLKLLNKFTPIKEGFETALFIESENNIVGVVKKTHDSTGILLLKLDALSGKLVSITDIDFEYSPKKIIEINNKIILICESKIVAIYKNEIIWDENIVLPHYDIVPIKSDNSICYALENKFVKISVENGKELWTYNYPEKKIDSENPSQILRPVLFKTLNNDKRIAVVIAETNRGIITAQSILKKIKLLFIDYSGNVTESHFNFPSNTHFIDLNEELEGKIKLFIDQKEYYIND